MSLKQDRDTPMRDTQLLVVPVAGNVLIHAGAMVAANTSGTAIPGTSAPDLLYLGRAETLADNRGGNSGDVNVEVRRNKAFQWGNDGSINASHLFHLAYIIDDQTVGTGDIAQTHSLAGRIVGVEARGVWIEATDFRQEKTTDAGE